MPTDDLQILVAGQAKAPAGFVVPGNGQIRPKALNVVYDGTNAAGDFLPTLEIVSDAGIVVARCPAPTVVAGASAEVSWFPRLAAAAAAGKAGTCDAGYDGQATTYAVPDSTVVDLRLHVGTSYATSPDFDSVGAGVRGLVTADYMVFARAEWAAGFAGDRYMTVYQSNPTALDGLKKPVTFRQSTSPNGTVMWCAAGFQLSSLAEAPMEFFWDVFQSSGGPQTIQNYTYQVYCFAFIWPTF